jgi:hypothetical protein
MKNCAYHALENFGFIGLGKKEQKTMCLDLAL